MQKEVTKDFYKWISYSLVSNYHHISVLNLWHSSMSVDSTFMCNLSNHGSSPLDWDDVVPKRKNTSFIIHRDGTLNNAYTFFDDKLGIHQRPALIQ